MSAYTQILYQLVFSTKYRSPTLLKENRKKLYHYIYNILIEKNCFVFQIGGIEDHIHIVFSLHSSISLSNLVKNIKLATSYFIKNKNLFHLFEGWQEGYSAFTYSAEAKANLIAYVKNQEEHHKKQNSVEELKQMLEEAGLEYDEKYLL